MTLDVYAHLINPTNPESASKLEGTVLIQTGHNLVTQQKKGSVMLAKPFILLVRLAGFEPAAYGFVDWLPMASNFLKFL